jgi:hypothetical protein
MNDSPSLLQRLECMRQRVSPSHTFTRLDAAMELTPLRMGKDETKKDSIWSPIQLDNFYNWMQYTRRTPTVINGASGTYFP